ncbi:hypothetical protein GCM10027612_75770 [Microbispora bryophytorum subsp. camponoti]
MASRYARHCAVRVEDGIVHLDGDVERRSQLCALMEEVWQADGVVDVDSSITYEIDDVGRAVPAGALRRTGPAEGGRDR